MLEWEAKHMYADIRVRIRLVSKKCYGFFITKPGVDWVSKVGLFWPRKLFAGCRRVADVRKHLRWNFFINFFFPQSEMDIGANRRERKKLWLNWIEMLFWNLIIFNFNWMVLIEVDLPSGSTHLLEADRATWSSHLERTLAVLHLSQSRPVILHT